MNKHQKLVQQQFLNDEEKVIKRLKSVYNQSLKDIEGKAKALQDDIDNLGKLAKLSISQEEKEIILSQQRAKVYQKKYQDSLKKQVSDILDKMHSEEFTTVSEYLTECYEDGFIGTMFDLQGQNIPLCFPLDQEAMVRAVQLDSKISKGLYERLGEDVTTLKKKITAQVSRSISTGMTFQQTAQQLAAYTNIGFNNAVRIARTEGHRIQVQSGMDACYKAQEKGCDVVKQWDSAMDKRTRKSHTKVDGEIRELDEPFSNGLMFPGDPDGGAAEVINCRCALLQRARWAGDDSFTKMNNFSKQIETFDSPEDYAEFKKAFFSNENRQYMDYIETLEERYETKDFRKLLDLMSDSEYKHYSKLLNSNPVYGKPTASIIHNIKKKLQSLTKTSKSDIIQSKYGFKKIKGVHSIGDDATNTNPNYRQGRVYQQNCTHCVPAYEMRRRGYEVIATKADNGDKYMCGGGWKTGIFDKVKWQRTTSKRKAGQVQEITQAMLQWGEGARAEIRVQWDRSNWGHVFAAEVKNGAVVFVDPQNGKTGQYVEDYFSRAKPSSVIYGRIDNADVLDGIKDVCKGGTK